MLTVEVQGKTLVVREISDQWGETCHKFLSRPELMDWAQKRFLPDDFPDGEEGLKLTMEKLKNI
jgi:hypothetical protein